MVHIIMVMEGTRDAATRAGRGALSRDSVPSLSLRTLSVVAARGAAAAVAPCATTPLPKGLRATIPTATPVGFRFSLQVLFFMPHRTRNRTVYVCMCGLRGRAARTGAPGDSLSAHQKSGKRGSFSASGVRLVFQEKPSGPDSVEELSRLSGKRWVCPGSLGGLGRTAEPPCA